MTDTTDTTIPFPGEEPQRDISIPSMAELPPEVEMFYKGITQAQTALGSLHAASPFVPAWQRLHDKTQDQLELTVMFFERYCLYVRNKVGNRIGQTDEGDEDGPAAQ